MSLDVVATSVQVTQMAASLQAHAAHLRVVPLFAAELLRTWHVRPEEAQAYLEGIESGGVWPFAVPIEPLLTAVVAPVEPSAYAVAATDGSQIDADNHGLIQCFLLNIGWAAIAYGSAPEAWLASRPQVYYRSEDVYVPGEDGRLEEVGEHLLALSRTVAELEQLAEMADEWRDRPGLIAIADGNLVRWEFGGKRPDSARTALLGRYTAALARFRKLEIPVCGYISRPNAREVANAIALLAASECAGSAGACRHCLSRREPLCESLRIIPDRTLLAHLRPGERSALFRSLAPVVRHYHSDDQILFSYLRVGDEIARLEFPRWIADQGHLLRVQAAIHGQCLRGRGYPVVLTEAHEQAVIHSAARTAFRALVVAALHKQNMETSVSAKRLSKDQRAV